ncbi:MAG: AAA family ATPase [Isosphaeraceae bacterium]
MSDTRHAPGEPAPGHDEVAAVAALAETYRALRGEIAKVIIGQDDVVDQLLIGLFARGHVLLVGVPGLAKTLLVSTVSRILSLSFRRIQFTPDMMPSDITGTDILQDDPESGRRRFAFIAGPIFAHIILADEINRTPPKTQAALLEAMQERHVTAAGNRYPLPDPFFVLATQNPIEQEGTYPCPRHSSTASCSTCVRTRRPPRSWRSSRAPRGTPRTTRSPGSRARRSWRCNTSSAASRWRNMSLFTPATWCAPAARTSPRRPHGEEVRLVGRGPARGVNP